MLYAADGLKRSSEERFPGILRDWGVGSLWFNWNYYALAWVASDTRIRHEPELRRQFTVYVVDAVLAAAAALCLVFML